MTRFMVIVHVIATDGATSRRTVRQFFLNASTSGEAWRKARDIVRNDRQDVDGEPEIRRAEPGDETVAPQQAYHEPTREGFNPEGR